VTSLLFSISETISQPMLNVQTLVKSLFKFLKVEVVLVAHLIFKETLRRKLCFAVIFKTMLLALA
jgi:hypothetical protein